MTASIKNNDLFLVNRDNKSYSVTGEQFKKEFGSFFVDDSEPPIIDTVIISENSNSSEDFRFGNQYFDVTTTMVEEGIPESSYQLKAEVGGILYNDYLISDIITGVVTDHTNTTLKVSTPKNLDKLVGEVFMTDDAYGPFTQTPYTLTTNKIANVGASAVNGWTSNIAPGNSEELFRKGLIDSTTKLATHIDANGELKSSGFKLWANYLSNPITQTITYDPVIQTTSEFSVYAGVYSSGAQVYTVTVTYSDNSTDSITNTTDGIQWIYRNSFSTAGKSVKSISWGDLSFTTFNGVTVDNSNDVVIIEGSTTLTFDSVSSNPDLQYFEVGDVVQEDGIGFISETLPEGANYNPKNAVDNNTSTYTQLGPSLTGQAQRQKWIFNPPLSMSKLELSISNAGGGTYGNDIIVNKKQVTNQFETSLTSSFKTFQITGVGNELESLELASAVGYGGEMRLARIIVNGAGLETSVYSITSIDTSANKMTVDGGSWLGQDGSGASMGFFDMSLKNPAGDVLEYELTAPTIVRVPDYNIHNDKIVIETITANSAGTLDLNLHSTSGDSTYVITLNGGTTSTSPLSGTLKAAIDSLAQFVFANAGDSIEIEFTFLGTGTGANATHALHYANDPANTKKVQWNGINVLFDGPSVNIGINGRPVGGGAPADTEVTYDTGGGKGTIVSTNNDLKEIYLTNTGNRNNRWIADNIKSIDFFCAKSDPVEIDSAILHCDMRIEGGYAVVKDLVLDEVPWLTIPDKNYTIKFSDNYNGQTTDNFLPYPSAIRASVRSFNIVGDDSKDSTDPDGNEWLTPDETIPPTPNSTISPGNLYISSTQVTSGEGIPQMQMLQDNDDGTSYIDVVSCADDTPALLLDTNNSIWVTSGNYTGLKKSNPPISSGMVIKIAGSNEPNYKGNCLALTDAGELWRGWNLGVTPVWTQINNLPFPTTEITTLFSQAYCKNALIERQFQDTTQWYTMNIFQEVVGAVNQIGPQGAKHIIEVNPQQSRGHMWINEDGTLGGTVSATTPPTSKYTKLIAAGYENNFVLGITEDSVIEYVYGKNTIIRPPTGEIAIDIIASSPKTYRTRSFLLCESRKVYMSDVVINSEEIDSANWIEVTDLANKFSTFGTLSSQAPIRVGFMNIIIPDPMRLSNDSVYHISLFNKLNSVISEYKNNYVAPIDNKFVVDVRSEEIITEGEAIKRYGIHIPDDVNIGQLMNDHPEYEITDVVKHRGRFKAVHDVTSDLSVIATEIQTRTNP